MIHLTMYKTIINITNLRVDFYFISLCGTRAIRENVFFLYKGHGHVNDRMYFSQVAELQKSFARSSYDI